MSSGINGCVAFKIHGKPKKVYDDSFYEVPAIRSFRELVTTRLRKTLPDNSG